MYFSQWPIKQSSMPKFWVKPSVYFKGIRITSVTKTVTREILDTSWNKFSKSFRAFWKCKQQLKDFKTLWNNFVATHIEKGTEITCITSCFLLKIVNLLNVSNTHYYENIEAITQFSCFVTSIIYCFCHTRWQIEVPFNVTGEMCVIWQVPFQKNTYFFSPTHVYWNNDNFSNIKD